VSRQCGIDALKRVSGIVGEVSSGDVGFRLAPRLNAAGRLDDATRAVELLLCREREPALQLAAELDAGNAERQAIERDILEEARERVAAIPRDPGRKSIVLASAQWHAGVIGIVASRLVELYHLPTVLISLQDGSGKGSARSIPRFDLYGALCECAPCLRKFGGHKYAAGLSLDGDAVEEFAQRFDLVAAGCLTADDLIPELHIDAELPHEGITPEMAGLLLQLGPFGAGNPEPTILLRDMRVAEKRVLKDKHLKLILEAGGRRFDAIGFNMADRAPETDRIDCVCFLQMNEWNGRRALQLRLRDFREQGL
jgi:single-stranded-DNA-specific exonuclease